MKSALRECFHDPILDVMNFLNEVVLDYPRALSFAPGRPQESLFDVEADLARVHQYVREQSAGLALPEQAVWGSLGQYGRTNGSINEIVAAQLARDEHIHVSAEDILITVGAQEAMAIALIGLLDPREDILLVSDPTYIGMTGLARLLGIRVLPVESGPDGISVDGVRRAISHGSQFGRIRALYDIPDFNNPLGTCMPLNARRELLELCKEKELLFIEDNPYGMFNYDYDRVPTLKSMDEYRSVLYIGSFSKTMFPSLRLGYLIADQTVDGGFRLSSELSKVKSLVTVNTPAISQGIVAHALYSNGYSLEPIVAPKRECYRRSRNALLDCLERNFDRSRGFDWNTPSGGFFLTLRLPFNFGINEVRRCAADYGVVVCPMSFFSLTQDRNTQIRLSFSYLTEAQIAEGVRNLSRFCEARFHRS